MCGRLILIVMLIFTNTFNSQVQRDGVTVSSIPVNVAQGEVTISDLSPDTQYSFTILAANQLGRDILEDVGNTTSGRFGTV